MDKRTRKAPDSQRVSNWPLPHLKYPSSSWMFTSGEWLVNHTTTYFNPQPPHTPPNTSWPQTAAIFIERGSFTISILSPTANPLGGSSTASSDISFMVFLKLNPHTRSSTRRETFQQISVHPAPKFAYLNPFFWYTSRPLLCIAMNLLNQLTLWLTYHNTRHQY